MATPWVQFAGPEHGLVIGGVRLLGFNAVNARKLLFTAMLLVALYLLSKLLRLVTHGLASERDRAAFWTRQGVSLVTFLLGIAGLMSIWFDNPARLATGVGLVGAGLAFAL